MAGIFGILNVTRDSFSDGGRYFDPDAAVAHGRSLIEAGADVVDVGAESTHPDAEAVSAATEIARLQPVVERLHDAKFKVSVDTNKPEVMRAMNSLSVAWLNDVAGFRTEASVAAAAEGDAGLVVMFARSGGGKAHREQRDAADVVDEALAFFDERIASLTAAGVARERLVLDPGMGLFLGAGPLPSVSMLRGLDRLRAFGLPLLVSVSRKSFLGELTGRTTGARGAATLAAELYAATRGVEWIRTHDPASLRDALAVWEALGVGIGGAPRGPDR
ncbi:MAG: dihydropteroate synthase [Planctomycetota bacterium]|nr:dihydropteroate synthase [Planctomycetota bacterium]